MVGQVRSWVWFVACLLLIIVCVSADDVSSRTRATMLDKAQRKKLTALINFGFASQNVNVSESDEELCIAQIVRAADEAFTILADKKVRKALSGQDHSVPDDQILSLRNTLRTSMDSIRGSEPERVALCGVIAAEEVDHIVQSVIVALTRALEAGNNAQFLVASSFADIILDYLALGDVGFTVILLLATFAFCYGVNKLVGRYFIKQQHCTCRHCIGEILLDDEVGEGAFGKVYKCNVDGEKQLSVIKFIKVDPVNDVRGMQDAIDEATHLVTLTNPPNPHVVAYKEVFFHTDASSKDVYVCIVMEYCSYGTLEIAVQQKKRFTFFAFLTAIFHVAQGLAYTHAHNIIHCDIKLANIFITEEKDANKLKTGRFAFKIGDFGLAQRFSTAKKMKSSKVRRRSSTVYVSGMGGTSCFRAPEQFAIGTKLRKKDGLTAAVDAWALGCALWEAATGKDVAIEQPYWGQLALEPNSKIWQQTLDGLTKQLQVGLEELVQAEILRNRKRFNRKLKKKRAQSIESKKVKNNEHKTVSPQKKKIRLHSEEDVKLLPLSPQRSGEWTGADEKAEHAEMKALIPVLVKLFVQLMAPNPRDRPELATVCELPLFDQVHKSQPTPTIARSISHAPSPQHFNPGTPPRKKRDPKLPRSPARNKSPNGGKNKKHRGPTRPKTPPLSK